MSYILKKYKYLNHRFKNNNLLLPKSNWQHHLILVRNRKKFNFKYSIWIQKLSDRKLRRIIRIYKSLKKREFKRQSNT